MHHPIAPISFARRLASTGFALGLALLASSATALEAVPPKVDTAVLPAQTYDWTEPNPLRGNQQAIALGQSAFNQSCARCHGVDANGSRSPAPDLRRLGMGCKRIADAALRQRCMADADAFFIKSVRWGKQKFGIVHMPPWEGVLSPDVVWSLRSFVETAPAR